MKKILVVALCFFALKANCQKVDESITRCTAAQIKQIIYTHRIPVVVDTITHIGFFDYNDNLKGKCVVKWVLLNANKNVLNGEYQLTEAEYTEWSGDEIGLLRIIANYLKVDM